MGKFSKIIAKTGLYSGKSSQADMAEGVDFESMARTNQLGREEWDERFLAVSSISWQAAESFRILRSRIVYPADDAKELRTIMITSSSPSEGKSFVSANLGLSIAKGLDQHALVVDCDLRRPTLAKLFGLQERAKLGLANYLAEPDCELAKLLQKTSVPKLSILPSGVPPTNPAELLASVRMSSLVRELASRYADRYIIFDSPPFQVASETIVLAQAVDAVVLVVGYGKSDRHLIRNLVENIGREKIIGVVFNGMKSNLLQQKVLDGYGYAGGYYGSRREK